MGGVDLAHGDERAALVEALNRNLYAFSAAKSLYQFKRFRELMVDADGNIRQHAAFKKAIADEGNVFNRAHLRAEYNLAQNSAIMADKWDRLNTEFLEYTTVGDARVRPEHKALDKFTAAKDDQVWNKIYPPKAFGCRCTVVPGKSQNVGKVMSAQDAAKMMRPYIKDTIFDNHVGKSRVVFKEEHPVFVDSNGKESRLSWQQYGMRPYASIRTDELPELKGATKSDFEAWRNSNKSARDITGTEVLLGQNLKVEGSNFAAGVQAASVIKKPHEIWQTSKGKTYVRYYDGGAVLVSVGHLRVATSARLESDPDKIHRERSGILIYRQ